MNTDYKVTQLFCVIDDFFKYFEAENAGKLFVEDKMRDIALVREEFSVQAFNKDFEHPGALVDDICIG